MVFPHRRFGTKSIPIIKGQEDQEKIIDPRKWDQCGLNVDKEPTTPQFT